MNLSKSQPYSRFAFVAAFTFLLQLVFAQTGSVRGFVYNKSDGEAVPFSNVYFKGTTIGANTDLNGFFSITKVPPGKYTLLITNLDFDTITEDITITAGEILSKKYYCTKGGIKLKEVEISAEKAEKIENTTVAVQKIDPTIIAKLPSVGEPDLAQYLQVLPGVVFTGDQGGQLYIRGGLPVQNKVLMDGMQIYNPFHSIGLFSVFDNDIMKNADVYSAGFNAEYGGRTSSVMDITTRDGNKKRLSGKVAASTFAAKMVLEGPFVKLKEDGKGSASFIVSAKHSYLPQTSKSLYRYANKDGLPFYFTDIYGKASINATNGSKISVFGFNFNDKVDYPDIATYNWTSTGAGSNFVLIPSGSNLLIEGVFAFSNYNIGYQNPKIETDSKKSGVSGFNGGFNFIRFVGRSEVKFGFEGIITNTTYQLQNPFFTKVTAERSTTDISGYVKYKYVDQKKRFIFEPGFRLMYYASLNVFSPEPRASLKINFTPKIRFKGAAGLYSQTLMSASSDRDVVNLFYGFINAPENQQMPSTYLDKDGKTQKVNSSVQRANHVVAGFEFDIMKYIDLNIEVYQKNFNQVINTNRDKLFDDTPENASKPDALKKDYVVEQGRARGFDVVLKFEYKRFYLWSVYSLTLNDRWQGNTATGAILNYPPNFDRRHNVNLVGSYTFGKKRNFEVNVRWNYGSPFPTTPTQGYYPAINFNNNLNYNYTTSNAELGYLPGDLNSVRLPDYHRLDIGFKYRYNWTEKVILEISGGATNAYNRENIFYVNRFTFERINQLPILPNLNLSLSF
ncbi:MAG: TonB-dependent receptor [Bacteroidia bacterium]|nr:TonB-dependent receptor [Bacteroidia bacterium]